MNKDLLRRHITAFVAATKRDPGKSEADLRERHELVRYYQQFTKEKILTMAAEDVYEYLSKLWAMRIWGNKHYVIDKIIEDNGLENCRRHLAGLIWGPEAIAQRWDAFRSEVKGVGPAMMSELLCKAFPGDFMLWNRRAYVALNYLQVEKLPRYDYQLTGSVYTDLCGVCKEIAKELKKAGCEDTTLLAVDYFIWDQLQVEDNLSRMFEQKRGEESETQTESIEESQFIHNDIRDKVRDIGQWLGFTAQIECKVSEGSKVDAVWEATIGNMGRVIYVFEVQTKGSIDSLIVNLLKSLNNSAVQGVVAVSDRQQLDKIKSHAMDVKELRDKLKYWDYEKIQKVHESLAYVNESINDLDLVPQGF